MTSSRSNSRWKIFLMASCLSFSILAMTYSSRAGSRTVSGLMMAMVKGRLICLGSKSASSI